MYFKTECKEKNSLESFLCIRHVVNHFNKGIKIESDC